MADGMTPTDDVGDARVVVLNTCAIRENADNKLYGNLGHLKPLKDADPSLRIVVAGCLAQKDQGVIQRKAPWVDVVVGTHALPQLLDLLRAVRAPRGRRWTCASTPRPSRARCRPRGATRSGPGCRSRRAATTPARSASCRSSVARSGRARSATSWPRCRDWPRRGVVEVTLLGQNVNTYGRDVTVPGLVAPAAVRGAAAGGRTRSTGIRRVRFTSPHPHDFTPDVIEAMAETPSRLRAHPLPAAVGLGPGAEGDAALVPARALPRMARRGSARRSPRSPSRPTSSWGSPARPRRTSPTRSTSSSARGSTARTRSSTRRGRARGRRRSTTRSRRRSCRSASTGWSTLQQRISLERSLAQVGAHVRGAGRGRRQARAVDAGAHADEPDRASARRARGRARSSHARITEAARAPPGRRAGAVAGGRGRLRRPACSTAPLALVGPTAVGKTEAALALAERARGGDRLGRLDARVPRDGRRHGEADAPSSAPRAAPPDRRRRAVGAVLASRGSRRPPGGVRRLGARGRAAAARRRVGPLLPGGRGRAGVPAGPIRRRAPTSSARPTRWAPSGCTGAWPRATRSRPRGSSPGTSGGPSAPWRSPAITGRAVLDFADGVGALRRRIAVRAAGLRLPREPLSTADRRRASRAMLDAGLARRGAGPGRAWVRRMAHLHAGHRLR